MRNPQTRLLVLAGGMALVLGLAACSPTSTAVLAEWTATGRPTALRSVLVVAKGMTEPTRMRLEDAFVVALVSRGVAATPSYRVIPQAPYDDVIKTAALRGNFDGVLLATERSITTDTAYQQAYSNGAITAGGVYGSGWNGAWLTSYPVQNQIVDVQITLSDGRSGAPLWSATTETNDPTSDIEFVRSLTDKVTPALEGAGLIPSKL